MKEWIKWIIIALLLVAILICAYVIYNHFSHLYKPNQPIVEGDTNSITLNPAPDFTVIDKDGNNIKLSDMKGKPVIINFWATWCPYCVQEMPDFEEAYKTYGDKVHFMMINVTDGYQETLEKAKNFISQKQFTFPVYYDTKIMATKAYSAFSLPCTFFIDAEGNLDSHILGMLTKKDLVSRIDRLLK